MPRKNQAPTHPPRDAVELAMDVLTDRWTFLILREAFFGVRRYGQMQRNLGIARNVLAQEHRRQGHERRAVGRLSGRRLLDPDSQTRIEERIDAERAARTIYQALQNIPERDRALLELVAVDGLAISEAAAALNIPPSTARVRLHRARAKVRLRLPALVVPEVQP